MIAVHAPTKSILLQVPDPLWIRDLLPLSRTLDHPKFNIAIKHTAASTTVLRNLGYDAPDPILSQYDWPGKFTPFDHQRTMADFLCRHARCFNLSEQGTGKTNGNLWASDWLMKTGVVHRVLVLAPLSTLERVWQQDIFDTLMHRLAVVVHGTTEQREKALAVDADYYLLNHDGVSIKWLARELRRRKDIDLIIMDEGSLFRNDNTTKYKALLSILREDTRIWWNTGTPCPNAPTDAYAQAKIVNPKAVPQFFGTFKRATMMQVSPFKWVPRPGATEQAFAAMQPAIRFVKKDCLDLPPVTYAERQALLTPEQRKAYESMAKDMYLDAKAHADIGKPISAVNAADKLGKLRQLLCIAEDTPVLTKRGWVPIQFVWASDRVWDGEEWVQHDGLVAKGRQVCIRSDGVWMTPGHEVLTPEGWRTASGKSRNQLDRAPVRLPHGVKPIRYDDGHISESRLALSMRLWPRDHARKPEPTHTQKTECQTLWVQDQGDQRQARNELHSPVPHLDTHEAQMLRPDVQGLQKLRREGHHHLSGVGRLIRGVLERYAGWVRSPPEYRPARQQRSLRETKLPVGHSEGAKSQPTTSLRVVYDILNCGPRQRFVVRGRYGELVIVHNCGVVKDPDTGNYISLPHAPRTNVLLEAIEGASAKVIVVVPFKGIIQSLEHEIGRHHSVGVLNGDVSPGNRNRIIREFKGGEDPHVLLCHPKVMSHGLNLTEADTLVFYAPIYSNDEYQQVTERFNRAGQKRKMTIIRIGAHPIEWDIYKLVDNRQVTQQSILKLYQTAIKQW